MKHLLASIIALSPVTLSAISNWNPTPLTRLEKNARPSRIVVENRVLANISEQPISVLDVMKKMDTYFYKDYPHLIDSDIARYQFYKGHWNYVFDDMVNNQLIYSDAKSDARINKHEVSRGDIRQEMERLYGPNIITNLDKIGLSYDEAWKMTEKDIYVRRRIHYILMLKGVYNTSPADLLTAFEAYTKKNKKPDHWVYHILSFRGPNALENAQMAKGILDDLNKNPKNFNTLALLLKERLDQFESRQITISDEFKLADSQISDSHKSILAGLESNTFSSPFDEVSRADKKTVYRVFYLAEHISGGKIEFTEVEDILKESLIQGRVDQEVTHYIADLRDRFGISQKSIEEIVPRQFEPFLIR